MWKWATQAHLQVVVVVERIGAASVAVCPTLQRLRGTRGLCTYFLHILICCRCCCNWIVSSASVLSRSAEVLLHSICCDIRYGCISSSSSGGLDEMHQEKCKSGRTVLDVYYLAFYRAFVGEWVSGWVVYFAKGFGSGGSKEIRRWRVDLQTTMKGYQVHYCYYETWSDSLLVVLSCFSGTANSQRWKLVTHLHLLLLHILVIWNMVWVCQSPIRI